MILGVWPPELRECKFLLFEGIKLVIIYYGRLRKQIYTPNLQTLKDLVLDCGLGVGGILRQM